ncbi:SLC13 family permease [Geminisphaera colitermitum]|uniref:SLC13 family permease n=1 Tax=Geminisphaera colitermitum TaxID=1148786 RepID=UPI000158C8B0|nr:SLC13 family permease [Geminisphaera colitermitum]
MNSNLIIVLGLLLTCVVLFVANKPRMDVVALLVILALPLSGILTVPQAMAGFSDPGVVLIGSLFVIGEGLVRTGIAYRLGDWLVRKAGNSETRLLVLLMLSVAGLGSVMSSTGIVAIFIPVVLSVAARLRIPAGRLMMPLSFAGLISGMMTLVATPPNMVVDSTLKREGFAGFSFFSFTPIGAVVLLMGIGYMLVARRWLTVRNDPAHNGGPRRKLHDLIEDYNLAGREHRLRIRGDSPLVGRMLQDLHLRRDYKANIVGIERQTRLQFQSELLAPHAHTELRAGDVLLVDVHDAIGIDLSKLREGMKLESLPLRGSYFTDQSREVGMAEIALPPDSGLIGKTVLELGFRSKHSLNVVGLRRERKALEGGTLLEEKLRMGDTLLVIGPWKSIRQLQPLTHDFIVLSLPAEVDEVAPALKQAPWALASLVIMVGLMVTGIVPNVMAALIGCLLMGAFRCVDMDSAYKSINWQCLVLIAGMIPFALALEKTGGVELAVNSLLNLLGDAGPHMLLASLFVLTALIGLFVSNTATAVLMAPIALSMAGKVGASPAPFAMIVALAASAAFMTPVSSPVNTLVLGPGQYRFGDFVKVGVPFTVLVLVVSVLLVPWMFPLH